MSGTRLLVLGAVHFMQPVSGYAVRRELVSWRMDDHVNVKPGSIYSALRTLERDGCVAVEHEREGAGDTTTYVTTTEGEKELQILLRDAWWRVTPPAQPLLPALTLMTLMSRDELGRALQARAGQLEGRIEATGFFRASIQDGATGADGAVPEHVREVADFLTAQARAELDWTRTFAKRLRDGAYRNIQD